MEFSFFCVCLCETVKFSETDIEEGGDWGFDSLELQQSSLGYALGQKGSNTKIGQNEGYVFFYVNFLVRTYSSQWTFDIDFIL
jgi:hypothetical protein